MQTEVLVLGAGPAGIGAGLALGDHALVIDAAAEVGGLARTVDVDGALFDLGGHSFHTPHPEVRDLVFGALAMEERKRDAWCLVGDAWIPYPFQKHFEQHPDAAVVAACRDGLAAARRAAEARDFDAYLDARFGAGISTTFMKPYNRKLWGGDLARMSLSWTAERVWSPAGSAERSELQDRRRKPLQDDTPVAYPARGGFGEIFVALARRLPRLELGRKIAAIDPSTRTATVRDGLTISYREIVSTLPLPRLLACVAGVPDSLRRASMLLEALPVTLVMLAVEGPLATTRQRVYVSDDAFPGHKIVLNANSSSWLAARARHGIQVEVSGPSAARAGARDLVDRAIDGVLAFGLVDDRRRIAATRTITLPLGYPVPTHQRPAIVERAKTWLRANGIHTLGRFGEWDYINSDEALHRGMRWPATCVGASAERLQCAAT
jgi:protoporphyrinogen oxidase